MNVGPYRLTIHNHGYFRLDGGAMFGSVPKALWAKESPPDEANRILMSTRSLVIESDSRKMLIDVGCGDKWTDKARAIFCIEECLYEPVAGVTDVLLTHLHFDHAGGLSANGADGIRPNYPNARHYVGNVNLENARNPNPREKASYLEENVGVLNEVDLILTGNGQEVWPGITVHRSDGHTRGMQWVKIVGDGITVIYPADLVPTSKHLPVAYTMGYDMCAQKVLEEKEQLIRQAIDAKAVMVFEHDPHLAAARLAEDERGRPIVAEPIEFLVTT